MTVPGNNPPADFQTNFPFRGVSFPVSLVYHSRMTHNSTTLRRRPHGFTLLEMVIVLGIIAIILGGIGYKMVGSLQTARISRVDGDMKTLDNALMQYKVLGGQYPSTQQGLAALVNKPGGAPVPRKWNQQLKEAPLDPWGQPYLYRYPGKKNTAEYEIICKGPDSQENTGDDISSQD